MTLQNAVMRLYCFLILLWILNSECIQADEPEGSYSTVLNPHTVRRFVRRSKLSYIYFFDSECEHCKDYQDSFTDGAELLREDGEMSLMVRAGSYDFSDEGNHVFSIQSIEPGTKRQYVFLNLIEFSHCHHTP